VARHPLALGAPLGHQSGGTRVERLTLQRRDLTVDRAPHQRVHEVELPIGGQHVDRHECLDRCARRFAIQAGHAQNVVERHRRAEDRDRPRDVCRVLVQRSQTATDSTAHALGAELQQPTGIRDRAAELLRRHFGHELAEQERVAAGRRVTGRREVVDRAGDACPDQRAGRLGREGGGTHDLSAGGGELVEQLLIGPGLVGAGGAYHDDRELRHALGHEHQPP
jgi:hypothetical protein